MIAILHIYMIRAWNQATLLRDNVTCDFWLWMRDSGAHIFKARGNSTV